MKGSSALRRRSAYLRRLRLTLLGRRLVSRGLVSEGQVREALKVASRTGRPLGQVLLGRGCISRKQLRRALEWQDRQRSRCEWRLLWEVERETLRRLNSGRPHQRARDSGSTRLGELLRRAGLVGAGHIGSALRRQKRTGEKLGQILVRAGHITRHALWTALRLQRRLRRLALAAGVCAVLALSPACNSYDYRGTPVQSTPWDAHWHRVQEALKHARRLRYRHDSGGDHWQTPEQTSRRGAGDCEDLSIWLYARLVEQGVHGTRLCVGRKAPRDRQFHSWVVWAAGDKTYILDPTDSGEISDAGMCPPGFYKPYYSYDVDRKYVHHRLEDASGGLAARKEQ